jgi:hypothetical protein
MHGLVSLNSGYGSLVGLDDMQLGEEGMTLGGQGTGTDMIDPGCLLVLLRLCRKGGADRLGTGAFEPGRGRRTDSLKKLDAKRKRD